MATAPAAISTVGTPTRNSLFRRNIFFMTLIPPFRKSGFKGSDHGRQQGGPSFESGAYRSVRKHFKRRDWQAAF
jgi:hypothetical protein